MPHQEAATPTQLRTPVRRFRSQSAAVPIRLHLLLNPWQTQLELMCSTDRALSSIRHVLYKMVDDGEVEWRYRINQRPRGGTREKIYRLAR